jgi:arylformamidase
VEVARLFCYDDFMQIVDLSVILSEDTPVYPGDPETKFETIATVKNDGHTDHYISTVNHTGTHIDAPMHMLANGKSLNDFPIEHFVGRGRYIKVQDNNFDLETVKKADIQAGDIILFHTGMSDHYHEPIYFEHIPAMSAQIAEYLVDCKVKMVGLDTGSADNHDKDHPIHKTLLAGNILIIENMTNLAQLEGKEFTVYALPLKLEVDGAPTRAIAEII